MRGGTLAALLVSGLCTPWQLAAAAPLHIHQLRHQRHITAGTDTHVTWKRHGTTNIEPPPVPAPPKPPTSPALQDPPAAESGTALQQRSAMRCLGTTIDTRQCLFRGIYYHVPTKQWHFFAADGEGPKLYGHTPGSDGEPWLRLGRVKCGAATTTVTHTLQLCVVFTITLPLCCSLSACAAMMLHM